MLVLDFLNDEGRLSSGIFPALLSEGISGFQFSSPGLKLGMNACYFWLCYCRGCIWKGFRTSRSRSSAPGNSRCGSGSPDTYNRSCLLFLGGHSCLLCRVTLVLSQFIPIQRLVQVFKSQGRIFQSSE